MEWKDELFEMLASFERQAIYSLSNIRMVFKRDGLLFNTKFKQHFLQASTVRLEQTYNQFVNNMQTIEEMFHSNDATAFEANKVIPTRIQLQNNPPIDLIDMNDSSDEENTVPRAMATTSLGPILEIDIQNNSKWCTDDQSSDVTLIDEGVGVRMEETETEHDISMNVSEQYQRVNAPNENDFGIMTTENEHINARNGLSGEMSSNNFTDTTKQSVPSNQMMKRFKCQL
ncbi:uncharacterized protein LOC116351696, partial [Contarinia nasturtii]|uniref:uncharacterized protein LOC116351696 n=1 Tax=Contarinia nasturtii TaxID=265458 RepID=UPI0012D4A762